MVDETLLTLAEEVRGKTLRLLDGVHDDAARFTAGLSNSIVWHAGHALMLVEHLCILPATGGSPQYPHGWFSLFGWQSRPAAVPADAWPKLSEGVERLRDQLGRLKGTIEVLTPGELARLADAARGRPLRVLMLSGRDDEVG